MKGLKKLGALAIMMALAGCYISLEPLIDDKAAVLPVDGPITVCLDDDDPCLTLERRGYGYFAESPDEAEDEVAIRFAPFVQAADRQVFIAEAGIREEDGIAYMYGLARRLAEPDARGATMQIAALDCEELDEAALDAFEASGGMIDDGKIRECQPASLDQLKQTLLAAHEAGLASDEWWQFHSEDF
ncbi:hypothetical protein [Henriciella mobilis]|nr:hypothetical protein [Henriciella mobilis]